MTVSSPIVRLDCVLDSGITNCELIGNQSTSTQTVGIELRGNVVGSKNITIEDCKFYQLGKAVYSNYDVSNVKIVKNKFEKLDKGIVLAETLAGSTGSFTGPLNILIADNAFVSINKQGIYAGANNRTAGSNIDSINNYFEDVGNGGSVQGDLTQVTEIITYRSSGNSSENDTFFRLDSINSSTFTTTTQVKPIILGPILLKSNSPKSVSVNGSYTANSPGSVFVYPVSTATISQNIDMDYTVYRPNTGVIRRGKVNLLVTTSTTAIKDDFTYIGSNDGDIKFLGKLYSGKQIRIGVISGGQPATITYTYTVRQ